MVTNTLVASDLERLVYDWLVRRKFPFTFQSSLAGGHFQLGGSVVDFIIPDRMLAWRVQGEYWHRGVEKTGSDIIQKEQLTALGYTVVDLLEADLRDPDRREQTLNLALRGQEMPQ